MTDPRTCPTCGAALAADAPGSACPKCLLQAGFATGGSAALAAGGRAPTPEELAPRFPGLVIETLLGRGGMGVVYKARHKALDREVALKVLPAALAGDASFAERFQREARALAKLQHPNIVAVHDFGESVGDDGVGLFWLVMEYVDGTNIRQAMRAGQIHPKEALAIVPQICDALQYAHEHGVVHRDIKPENVLLDKSGRVKVADFGLAKMMETGAADRTLTGAGQVMGTPHYMAPEQVEHPKDVDHRADIYSLGVVFYEMLTGELPIGRFAAPSGKCDVDARIDEIVLRTLEKEREARYQQVVQVKTDVGAVAAAPGAPAPAGPRTWHFDSAEEKARGGRLSKLAVAGVFGVPAAVVIALVADRFTHRTVPVVAAMGIALLGGWIASLVAWVRIHRSGERLRGRVWAAVGTFLPVVASCVAGPFVVLLSGTTPSMPREPDSVFLTGPDFDEISGKWNRLSALPSDAALDALLVLYDHDDRPRLQSLGASELRERAAAGALGLPLLPRDRLPRPLQHYRVTFVALDRTDGLATRANVTAVAGNSKIYFPMSRSFVDTTGRRKDSHWDFAVGHVDVQ